MSLTIQESISTSSHISGELIPGNQTRDWNQRWKLIQEEIQLISRPHTYAMSSESIHASQQHLFSFFIQTYHLKDALKEAALGLGLKPNDIENAITSDQRLALLADLANLDKHMKLAKPPRSGFLPIISKISGIDNAQGNGWRLSVKIMHGTIMLDGLAVAENAVIAWREKLTAWKII